MPVILKNNAFSTLATAITASDTAIVVADGSQFPSPTGGDYFYATLVSPAGTTEIVKVTARVSNSLTVVRAQDGSSAASFQVGALVEMRANAASIAEISDEASEISIADAGGYYTSDNVEGALQEAAVYNQGGAGAVSRNVQSRLRDFVSVKDFGAVGDGVTDDTVAIQAAVNASAGKTLDGSGLTYKVTATITGVASDTIIQNATFDFSTQPDTGGSIDRGFEVSGSIGSPTSLTSNTAVNANTVVVGSTVGFEADDLVFLTSNKVWDVLQGVVYGQYARIKSIDSGTQLSLYEPVHLAFNTADAASIAKVTPVRNVSFKNVRFIGANNLTQAQNALYIQYGEDCRVESCRFEYFDYLALGFFRCYKSIADKVSVFAARNADNAYGVAILGGCYACSVVNGFGEDTRHYVTVGDNDGINMFTLVNGCQVISSKDAGLDSHAAGMFTTFSNNMISMSSDRAGTSSHDGLIMQGAHSICANNTIIGAKGVGISFAMLIGDGTPTTVKIIGNTVIMDDEGYLAPSTTGMSGIYVYLDDLYGPDNIEGVQIIGNSIGGGQSALNGFFHVRMRMDRPNGSMKNVVIANNISAEPADEPPCYLEMLGANSSLEKVNISNNNFMSSGSFTGIYLYNTGSGATISDVNIGGNIIDTGASGIYLRGGLGSIDNARIGGNVYKNVSQPFTIDGTTSDINVDADDALIAPVTFTGSPATIGRGQYFIFNRGAAQVVNMPAPSSFPGRTLNFKNIQAQTVDSAASNVVPIGDSVAGTAILPAVDGAWVEMISDGTNWVIMQEG